MKQNKILIVAGEPSGDLHAASLVRSLKALDPGLQFFGMGGTILKDAGADITFDISALALVGFVEVWKNIWAVGRTYKGLLRKIDMERPSLAILVDYPGFNLRLAKELKKRAIPVIYYISPQVWAWGRDRINLIKRYVDRIIVFFKFEEELYKLRGINAEFAGHPLVDTVRASRTREETLKIYGLSKDKAAIALLPGSRSNEITTLLPIMARAAKLINARMPDTQFVIARYPDLARGMYERAVLESGADIKIADGDAYNVVASADFAIVASGTATLETAIIGTPLIIIYKVKLLTYIAYNFVARLRFLGIVNIIAGKEVAPELLQYAATPEKISEKAVSLLSDGKKLEQMRKELAGVKRSLGSPGASARAAGAVLAFIRANSSS
ncbi:MAG: lipid-A-disaccharide synthase [Candidatus Omnitrophota bacterium]|nr:lipid-A-disaccharide synthase [Candidatus Omnitrophota bacterium]